MGDKSIGYDHPDYKPGTLDLPVKCATQEFWDNEGMDEFTMQSYDMEHSRFVYLDRVAPELYIGRYHHGVCDAIPGDASKHTNLDYEYGVVRDDTETYVLRKRKDVLALAARNHAYMVEITPDGSECRCLYCGTTMDGYEGEERGIRAWRGSFDGPRRATSSETLDLGVGVITDKSERLLYMDNCRSIHTGRFPIGKCPRGGPHEAVLCWWNYEHDVRQSFCMFCGERWDGPPPGFWGLMDSYNTVERTLAEHANDVRLGRY